MELKKSLFLILLCLNVFMFATKLESEFSRVRMANDFYCAPATVSAILQYLGTPIKLEINQTLTQQLLALEIVDEDISDSFMHKLRDVLNFYTTDLNFIPRPYVLFPLKLKTFTSFTEIFFSLVENSLSRNAPVILGFNGNLPSYHSTCKVIVIIEAEFDESNPANSTVHFMDPWTSQFGVFHGGHLQNLLQKHSFLLLNIAKNDVIKGRNVQEEVCAEELKVITNFNFCNPTQIFKSKRQITDIVNYCKVPTENNPIYNSNDEFIVKCHFFGRDEILLKMKQISVQALMKIVSERTKNQFKPYFMKYLSMIRNTDKTCVGGKILEGDKETMFNLVYYGNAYIRDLLDTFGSQPYAGYFYIKGYRSNELKDLDPAKSFYVE